MLAVQSERCKIYTWLFPTPYICIHLQVPAFYSSSVPPAPAGLKWMQYLPGVPVLPPVAALLGPAYTKYVWEYDQSYQSTNNYKFSDLDKVTSVTRPICFSKPRTRTVAESLTRQMLLNGGICPGDHPLSCRNQVSAHAVADSSL